MLRDGLYEQIINNDIDSALAAEPLATEKQVETARIDEAEASKMLTQYVSEILEQTLERFDDEKESLKKQIELTNKLVGVIAETETASDLSIADRTDQLLLEIRDRKNSALTLDERSKTARPETSIAQTNLFTGAIHEPQMYTELKKEILSCSRIDMLVSFIKWSGLRLIIDELRAFAQAGGKLRIITTSYMGATDVKAIDEIRRYEEGHY